MRRWRWATWMWLVNLGFWVALFYSWFLRPLPEPINEHNAMGMGFYYFALLMLWATGAIGALIVTSIVWIVTRRPGGGEHHIAPAQNDDGTPRVTYWT
jgi:hypothetical protein